MFKSMMEQQVVMQSQMQRHSKMLAEFQKVFKSKNSLAAAPDVPVTPTIPHDTPPPSPPRRSSPRLKNKAKLKVEGGQRKRSGQALKRTLSFEQALRGPAKRKRKSTEDCQLRTELRMRLCALDEKLFKGAFHHKGTNRSVLCHLCFCCCCSVLCYFIFSVLC